MSALIGPAKAARIIAEEFAKQADETRLLLQDPRFVDSHTKMAMHEMAILMDNFRLVYRNAADRMEQAMREEAKAA